MKLNVSLEHEIKHGCRAKIVLIFDFILIINKSLELVKLNLVGENLHRIQYRL